MNETRCRAIVKGRSGGCCEMCGAPAESMHHRKNRSQGGKWEPSNIVQLCGDGSRKCHGMLTNTNGRRLEFEDKGWIVPSYLAPVDVPFAHGLHGHVFLDDAGGWRPVEFTEVLESWGKAQSGPFEPGGVA